MHLEGEAVIEIPVKVVATFQDDPSYGEQSEILDTDTTVFIPLETLERLAQQFDGNLHLRYRDTDGYKTRLEHVVDDALADRFGVRKT
jgi:hypothetical protein